MSEFNAIVVRLKATKSGCVSVMELNGYVCDSEANDKDTPETQPLHHRAEVPATATVDMERSPAAGGAHRERRVSYSRSGRQRIDSLKKNRPRTCSRFGSSISKLATQRRGVISSNKHKVTGSAHYITLSG